MSTRSIFLFCNEKGSCVSFSRKSWNSDPWMVIFHPLYVGSRTVRERLRKHPAVVASRPGAPNEGGNGATVVTLRD